MATSDLGSHDADSLLSVFEAEWFGLAPDERTASIGLYRAVARGEPVPTAVLADETGLPVPYLERYLQEASGIHTNDDGDVVAYWGLSQTERNHRFLVEGRTLYTWCAWDALFIPEIIGKTAAVESTCPVTEMQIRLTVSPTEAKAAQPAGMVLSFAQPVPSAIRQDVIASFCHYVRFFESRAAAEPWVADNEGTIVISLDDAFHLGRRANERRYGALLGDPC